MATVRFKLDPKNPRRGKTDWENVKRLSEKEIRRAARSDKDAPLLTAKELAEMERIPDVKATRARLGLTQEEFARSFHLSVATVRDWEQGRVQPDRAARSFLRVIAKIPDKVEAALSSR